MTVIPGDTYAERVQAGTLSGRADTSVGTSTHAILSTATPAISAGVMWYQIGTNKLVLNIGTLQSPIFRVIS